MATQNPIESEGTYPLPEAQVDRFLFKVVVDYPTLRRGGRGRRPRAHARRPRCASCSHLDDLERYAARRERGLRRPRRHRLRRRSSPTRRATRRATASRTSRRSIEYGASPRGPIGVIQAARALALLRGRGHVVASDVARPRARRPAPPPRAVLRRAEREHHRRRRPRPRPRRPSRSRRRDHLAPPGRVTKLADLRVPDGRQGPGRCRPRSSRRSTCRVARRAAGQLPGDRRGGGRRRGHRARPAARRTRSATTSARSTRPRPRAPASRTCACTCPSAR